MDEALLEQARRVAKKRKTTLSAIMAEALRAKLDAEDAASQAPERVRLPRGQTAFELPPHISWNKTQDIIEHLDGSGGHLAS